jgi:hypothetical protein
MAAAPRSAVAHGRRRPGRAEVAGLNWRAHTSSATTGSRRATGRAAHAVEAGLVAQTDVTQIGDVPPARPRDARATMRSPPSTRRASRSGPGDRARRSTAPTRSRTWRGSSSRTTARVGREPRRSEQVEPGVGRPRIAWRRGRRRRPERVAVPPVATREPGVVAIGHTAASGIRSGVVPQIPAQR